MLIRLIHAPSLPQSPFLSLQAPAHLFRYASWQHYSCFITPGGMRNKILLFFQFWGKPSNPFRFNWTRVSLFKREQKNAFVTFKPSCKFRNIIYRSGKNISLPNSILIPWLFRSFDQSSPFYFHCWRERGHTRSILSFHLWKFLFAWSENLPSHCVFWRPLRGTHYDNYVSNFVWKPQNLRKQVFLSNPILFLISSVF